MAKARFTKQQVEDALRETQGQVVLAARRLRCRYETLVRYLRRYPDLETLRNELKNGIIESVELKLVQRALEGDPWAVQFLLKTWARERYGDRVQIEQQSEVNLQLELSQEDRDTLYRILERAAASDARRLRDARE